MWYKILTIYWIELAPFVLFLLVLDIMKETGTTSAPIIAPLSVILGFIGVIGFALFIPSILMLQEIEFRKKEIKN